MPLLAAILGTLAGALAAWLALRPRLVELKEGLRDKEAELRRVEPELYALRERAVAAADLERQLEDRFKALSAEALQQLHVRSSEESRRSEKAVEHLVTPIRESLERVGNEVKTLERARRQDYGALTTQLRTLAETSERLRSETGSLVTALRAPAVRGRWGEMQLRRAVETAGMLAHCDFFEQVSVGGDASLRPDLVVKLPGGRNLVVDAKVPLQALLDALDEDDDAGRAAKLQDFVRHVRAHVTKLSAKAYWAQFSPTPDFVIMFLPGESFYRAALEQDPSLLELTANQRVVLASPTTLITLLRAVAVGWREEKVAESARAVNELGRELYERLVVMTEHFARLGGRLDGAVQEYNKTVGSLERRVLVSARRFTEHGVGAAKELPSVVPVERTSQPPQTIELPQRQAGEPGEAADAA